MNKRQMVGLFLVAVVMINFLLLLAFPGYSLRFWAASAVLALVAFKLMPGWKRP
jgi:hypothetical protein